MFLWHASCVVFPKVRCCFSGLVVPISITFVATMNPIITMGFVNAPAIAQQLVKNLQYLSVDVKGYQRKRDLFYNALTKIGYDVIKPAGAFYLFPKSPIIDDIRFVKILQKNRVFTVPGAGFGRSGHFRIAYCVSESTIEKSISRFQDAFQEIA